MRAISGQLPPASEDGWSFEIKWDGYRTIAFVADGKVRLQSSNLLDVTKRWPEVSELPSGVAARQAILDGEMVALDERGRPSFGLLQRGETPVTYVVFDVLEIEGNDTTGLTYLERRRLLRELVTAGPHWIVPEHHVGDGAALLEASAAQGLEGVMAKRVESRYEIGRRSPAWRKVKNRRQQEFVLGGWLPGSGGRENTFGAILVGVYEGAALRFAGRVGTGFNERELARLLRLFAELATDECPFTPPLPAPVRRLGRWLRPEVVVEVAFTEWTHDDQLRQPSYLGQRDDKAPTDVVREP